MGTDVAHLNRMGPHTEIDCLINATRTHADDDLLLLIAFDGVLVDYAGDPLHVRIPPKRLALLRQVQRGSRVVVGVISGRPLQDLRSRIPLGDEAAYVGLHGLEIAMLRCGWSGLEKMDDFQFIARQLAVQLHKSVGDVPGVHVEQKGPIVALHTREASGEDVIWSRYQMLRAASEFLDSGSMRLYRGSEVFEVLPNVGASRANAVAAVQQCLERRLHNPVFTVYIGEDVADDDARQAANECGIVAVVGANRSHVPSHLTSQDDVDAYMV